MAPNKESDAQNELSPAMWAYLAAPTYEPARWDHLSEEEKKQTKEKREAEDNLDIAWRLLLHEHMPYHTLDENQRNRFIEQVSALETELLKFKDPDAPPRTPRNERTQFETGDSQFDVPTVDWSGIDTRVFSNSDEGRRLIVKQARLMEQAYFVLRLDRYGNAPINRGLMNLFRAWSGTTAFDEVMVDYRSVFNASFLKFYRYYIRGLRSIERDPIPHPWDLHTIKGGRSTIKHVFTKPLSMLAEPEHRSTDGAIAEVREATAKKVELFVFDRTQLRPGVYLDSGIIELQTDESTPSSGDAKQNEKVNLPPTSAKK